MQQYRINKGIYLPKYENIVNVNVSLDYDPTTIINADEQFESKIDDVYVSNISDALDQYGKSYLPSMYIEGLYFNVTNDIPEHLTGVFNLVDDDMIVNADYINNVRKIKLLYLFGHEIGHRIENYKDTMEMYELISKLFNIPMERVDIIREIYADVIGNIVANTNIYNSIDSSIESEKNEHVKKLVLESVYR